MSCAVTLALEFGSSQPYVGESLLVAPAEEYADGIWKATTDHAAIPLTNPPMVQQFDSGQVFSFIEPGRRDPIYKQIPEDDPTANYVDLVEVAFIPSTSGIFGDAVVNEVISNPASEAYAQLEAFIAAHPGPAGPAGPGATDAGVAVFVSGGAQTPAAVKARISAEKIDLYTIGRLDRQCMADIRRGADAARLAFESGINYVYDWSTTSAGGAVPNDTAVQVSGNRLYYKSGGSGGAGVILPFPLAPGEKFRAHTTYLWKAGGTSDVGYMGPDVGAAGHAPALNSPDALMLGMNSLHARSYYVGANVSGLIAAPNSYGTTPTVDTTYEITIEGDATYAFLTWRALGSTEILHTSYISRANLVAAGKTINNILLAPVDARQLGGSSFGPVVITRSQQPPRQKTVKGIQIAGNAQSHFSSTVPATSDPYHEALPPNYDPRNQYPLAIFFHQSITGFEWSPWSEARMQAHTKDLTDAGYIVLAIRDNYDRYGNQTSIDTYLAAFKHIRSIRAISQVFFYGASMGTLTMWNALSHRSWPTPAACASIGGAHNLRYVYDLPAYTAAVGAQYGVAGDGSDYATKTAGYDPILTDPVKFRGVPWRFYTAADDTVQPIAGQNAMAALVAPYCEEADVVVASSPSGHLGANQYNGPDMVAFFNRYRDTTTTDSASLNRGETVTTTDPATMTNKRITARVTSVASTATLTVIADDVDVALVTAQAAALTIAAPTGTPTAGQELILRIKDNGTARALTWNAIFRAFGAALPVTTTVNKTLYVRALWNAADSKWDVINVIQEV